MEQNHTESGEKASSKYWLSLDQWRQDPDFLAFAEKEFQSSPLQDEDSQGGWARREFLKLMGASLALTSFGCMRRPVQMVVPYAKKPRDVVHGLANYYASSYVDGFEGFGILVTSRDGRPIKIEGNEEHPYNRGGMSARAHAHILSLYDPDRLNGPRHNLQNESKSNRETILAKYEDVDKAVAEQLKKGGVALLLGNSLSPSTNQLVGDFAGATNADVYRWDALTYEDLRAAQGLCYGKEGLPGWRFDKAEMIVSVGCDFLGAHATPTVNAKNFSLGRKAGDKMSKLVVLESLFSLTGANADERFRISGQGEQTVLMGLLYQLLKVKKVSRFASDAAVLRAVEPYADADKMAGLKAGTLAAIAEELATHGSKSLVVTGGWAQSGSSLGAQIAANLLNSVLGSDGVTVDYAKLAPVSGSSSNSDLTRLIGNLKSGKIKTVIIHGSNPGYAAGSDFAEGLKKAEMVIYTGDRMDETAVYADYILPDHHPLENWSDSEFLSGAYTIQQPTIQPLYNTRAFQDSLLSWMKVNGSGPARAKNSASWYDYVREYWRSLHAANRGKAPANKDFDDFWIAVLHEGVFETASERTSSLSGRSFNSGSLSKIADIKPVEGYVLNLYSTVGLRDGSLGNVSWLQEFPDPVTKICWDNYLTVSPKDAARDHLRQGELVLLKTEGGSLEVPVHIQPGQADGVLGLAVGYGRTRGGKVATNVGQNAYRLRQWKNGQALSAGLAAKVEKTGKSFELATVQDHHSMEGRQIVVEQTLNQFKANPSANIHRHPQMTMWSEHKYPNNKWGMVIDLNSCTGCGSCIVACQSENNIPTVGKKYVLKGREMHWIRIDRYYVGNPEDPGIVNQPIVCMHCDNAPCETVCPVIATVHSDEGTNDMIYNRCVGTRYCSNNCPYKVRRFNWFNYVKQVDKPLNYAMNPDVTVRARGVMEKCTFCIHRIRGVKSKAKLEDRQLKDGDVRTACQQSCPTNAITFGDLNDPESQVSRLFKLENTYGLLEELNTKPSVRYATKIRNTESLKGGVPHGESAEKGHHS